MKIYVVHSGSHPNYKQELYEPLKNAELSQQHELIFPHETNDDVKNSKKLISNCDLILADVSYSSTGMGIELGWANSYERRILCINKTGIIPSASLKEVSSDFLSYNDKDMLVNIVTSWIKHTEKEIT